MGWAEFFRMAGPLPQQAAEHAAMQANTAKAADLFQKSSSASNVSESERGTEQCSGSAAPNGRSDGHAEAAPPAPFVQPLYISKVNTVFQLGLIAGCIGQSWYGWPPHEVLLALGGVTGLTTVASFAAYVRAYRRGKLLRA